jgi:hypothetical protein
MNEGFPHVFGYRIQARSENACDVEVRLAGKWTARMVPRWMVWLWMRWIMQFAVQQVERKLLLYRLWLGRQGRGRESGAGMS